MGTRHNMKAGPTFLPRQRRKKGELPPGMIRAPKPVEPFGSGSDVMKLHSLKSSSSTSGSGRSQSEVRIRGRAQRLAVSKPSPLLISNQPPLQTGKDGSCCESAVVTSTAECSGSISSTKPNESDAGQVLQKEDSIDVVGDDDG